MQGVSLHVLSSLVHCLWGCVTSQRAHARKWHSHQSTRGSINQARARENRCASYAPQAPLEPNAAAAATATSTAYAASPTPPSATLATLASATSITPATLTLTPTPTATLTLTLTLTGTLPFKPRQHNLGKIEQVD